MKKKNSIILLFLLSPFFVLAQWNQIGDNINGEATGDRLGRGLSISNDGNILAIGSFLNDTNGNDSGHVRVYENIGGVWTQIGDDIKGEAAGDESGFSIDLNNDGSIIAIGARKNAGVNGQDSGHVRVFGNIGGIWTQIGDDIDGEATGDFSGQEIDLSDEGNVLAIGANANDANGLGSGHVRVYENIEGTWIQIGDDIDGEAVSDSFGSSVSLNNDGNIIAISALIANGTGQVKLFENIGGTWIQIGNTINGEGNNDLLGTSVSLNKDGNIVAIGAFFNDGVNGEDSGHARIFENIGGIWTQIGDDIDGEAANDLYGVSVSLNDDGNIVAIGGFLNDGINGEDSGHTRVFENIGGVWNQIGNDIDGEVAGDESGVSIALSADGGIIAIGAWKNDTNGVEAGHVKVYGNASLSIEDTTFEEKINVYPNPTFGFSNITFDSTYSNLTLSIYDSTGRIVEKESHDNIDRLQINIQDYASGIYFLRIISDEKYANIKLIKR